MTLAFCYGLTTTPLQLAQAYAIFANEWRRVPLTLLKRADGEQPSVERVISEEVAQQVLTVLHRVTGSEGTAKKARVPGFSVGGKTGTVHKVGPSGYLPDQYLALFVGVAPIDNPRYVTAVVIDRHQGDSYGGGAAAAPVYARITDGVLRLRNQRPEIEAETPAQLASFGGGQ